MSCFSGSNISVGKGMVTPSLVLFFLITLFFSFPAMGSPPKPPETINNRYTLFTEKYFLNIDNGLITLIADSKPLGPVMEEVGRRSGIRIEVSPAIRSKKITVNWKGIPFDAGLKKLAENTGLLFRNNEDGSYCLSESNPDQESAEHSIKIREEAKLSDHNSSGAAISSEEVSSRNENQGNGILLNEMIIRFRQGMSEQDINKFLSDANIKIKKYIAPLKYHILALPEGMSYYDAMALLKSKNMLYRKEPEYLVPVK